MLHRQIITLCLMRHEDSCQYGTESSWAPVSSKAEQISLKIVESTIFESLNWNDLGLRPSVLADGWVLISTEQLPISPAFSFQIRMLQYTLCRHYGWCYAVSLVSMKYAFEAERLSDWEDVILINMTPIDSSENGNDWFWNLISPKVYLIPLSAPRWLGGKRVWIPKVHG